VDQPHAEEYLIGCDWGTTSVRLALIRREDHQVLKTVGKKEGVAIIASDWKTNSGVSLQQYFFHRLQPLVQELQREVGISLENIPICMSGMASSSIGIKELPYANLPLSLSGSGLVKEEISVEGYNKVLLVSGLRGEDEVMRGEEVQIIGIREYIRSIDSCMVVLPGTHSKHVGVSEGQIGEIKTYMTGELFTVLSQHTVLRHSVQSEVDSLEDVPGDCFLEGLQQRGILSNLLFSIRTGTLFGKRNVKQSRDYLLGLLIGHEFSSFNENHQMVLCSSGPLLPFYAEAMKYFFSNRSMILDEKLASEAAFKGQSVVFGLKS